MDLRDIPVQAEARFEVVVDDADPAHDTVWRPYLDPVVVPDERVRPKARNLSVQGGWVGIITSKSGLWRWTARARDSLYISGVLATNIRKNCSLPAEKHPPIRSTDVGPRNWPGRPLGRPRPK